MTTVTIYSKPDCWACEATIRQLNKLGVPFDKVDITQDEDALDYVRSLGHNAVPVVETPDEMWSGYRYEKIRGLSELVTT